MNKFLSVLGWVIILALVLTACSSPASSRTDAVTVLENYFQALTNNDIDKAMSYVADGAVFIDPMGRYVGKENIQKVYAAQMNKGGKWEATNINDTNGKGWLVYDFRAFINNMQVYSGTGLTVVKDGKIIFDGTEFLWKGECDRDPAQSFCVD